jgi:MFS family permease
VWLDRKPKRPIIIAADVVRGAALLVLPVAYFGDNLSVPLLLIVALLVGFCSVVADIGGAAILPAVVDRGQLIEGNSKLELSSSATNIGGNALGGAIVQIISGPFALLFNVASFIISTLFTALVRVRETAAEQPPAEQALAEQSLWRDIAEGAAFVARHPAIRVMVIATLIANFFALCLEPLFLTFITHKLQLAPFYIGLIFASSGAGAMIGAMIAGPLSRALQVGRVIVLSTTVAGIASILTPVASVMPKSAAVMLLVAMHVVDAAMIITCNINLRSYRASITPEDLQGRMNASIRMVVMGIAPIGAVFGGLLGGWIGITPSLVVSSIGIICSAVIIAFSPIRSVVQVDDPSPAEVAAEPGWADAAGVALIADPEVAGNDNQATGRARIDG